jgi:hypothetical protein
MTDETFNKVPFNMAIAYLIRCDSLMKLVNQSSINSDYGLWLNALEALYMEIDPCIKEEDIKKIQEILKKAKKNYNSWLVGMKITTHQKIKLEGSILELQLNELNLLIRRAMNEAGLLMPDIEDPRFALERS